MSFKTKVLEIGSMVPAFEEEMLVVLFGTNAPSELKDISVIHDPETDFADGTIKEGTQLVMGGNTYTVTKVGNAANANFEELGHLSIYFKDNDELLPGAIQVEPSVFPQVEIGEEISFSN
ncbi:PTS glucitol/sorbitol transporter subunit IIA [Ruoffia tabacinasalis]|uniref:PTS glucitol/sorbitol transporter subunit IIA n=1 Tax=Ruoffia tabacinasalis TaxID=87458 RepID=UPI003F979291